MLSNVIHNSTNMEDLIYMHREREREERKIDRREREIDREERMAVKRND